MKPSTQSKTLLGITQSKAKMYEYSVPAEDHIQVKQDPAALLRLTIGILGDYAALEAAPDSEVEKRDELRRTLFFSAQFFDSYMHSRLNSDLDAYLLLLGAASYYLCDFPGSSRVLVRNINRDINLKCEGLDNLLLALLDNRYDQIITLKSSKYAEWIDAIYITLQTFLNSGNDSDEITLNAEQLRRYAYLEGSPRELLIADIICAVIRKRIYQSSWKALPRHTEISLDLWSPVILKQNFIKEFWPAQMLLGEKGVYRGRSAVVQMPTSAGKTKSIEIIIRSAFLSKRANFAVIVAPFKALCTEIKHNLEQAFIGENVDIDSPSDTFQMDFDELEDLDLLERSMVLIATPEKLMYILRHAPELAERIGLLIFDEGHQFDSGLRGVTYELLLSSLKLMIKHELQTVLISAVISNSDVIGEWLNGNEGELISGINLSPTYRTVAFASWLDLRGRLEFVQPLDIDQTSYYVPRVIESTTLQKKPRERKDQIFPDKTDGKSIALYLGAKLVSNGAVAIFSGSKASVISMCEKIVDVYNRNFAFNAPSSYADPIELERLRLLHELHFGSNSTTTQSAAIGVFAHSANVPQGLRVAIEYAMQQGYIKFVICTSTLAQGVNLPIKYLIVTSVHQAGERIKTRDFHNLIGRAGRSGMHTEGSILFADPEVYDKKSTDRWRWGNVKALIDPSNSEPCKSTLASLFEPLTSDDERYEIKIPALEFVEAYLQNSAEIEKLPEIYAERFVNNNFSKQNLTLQIQTKIKIIGAIESYLMSYWEGVEIKDEDASGLAVGTLAYHLSTQEEKDELIKIFILLANNVRTSFTDPIKRKSYGKTLFGVKDLLEVESWVRDNVDKIMSSSHTENLLEILWPLLLNKITQGSFRRMLPKTVLMEAARDWINGRSYRAIFDALESSNAVLQANTRTRRIKHDTVVELCENAFGYDATLLIACVLEVLLLQEVNGKEPIVEQINLLQKQLKYGLSSELAIAFYEIGFQDRLIASELARLFSNFGVKRRELLRDIKRSEPELKLLLERYPAFYTYVLMNLTAGK
jgi:POLQ-like helicase